MYKTEFPDFDYELPAIEGFTDQSYRNDAMPRLSDGVLDVWCDYADASKREGTHVKQFCVAHSHGDTLFESDDIEKVRAFIRRHYDQWKLIFPAHHRGRWTIAHLELNRNLNELQWVRQDGSFVCMSDDIMAVQPLPPNPKKG